MKILGLSKCVQMQEMEEHIGTGYFKENIPEKNRNQETNPRIENRKYCTLRSVCGLALSQGMPTCGIQWECHCQVLQKYPLKTLDQDTV